jgi:antitoxin component of MazEF toxin-antitoxin module
VQLIQRAGGTRQFYLICPAQLAEALELEKGEEIEWVVEDKRTLTIRRRTWNCDTGWRKANYGQGNTRPRSMSSGFC